MENTKAKNALSTLFDEHAPGWVKAIKSILDDTDAHKTLDSAFSLNRF